MRMPSLQRALQLMVYVLGGVVGTGALLDAYNNTSIVSPRITYAATVMSIVGWLYLRRRLKKRPFEWTVYGNKYLVRKIGIAPTLAALGVIITLWMPRVAEGLQDLPPRGCQESTWTAISNYLSPHPSKQLIIAVADFQGPDEKHTLTPTIINRLRRATKEFPEVKIAPLDRIFKEQDGSDKAREEGRKCGASLVLWGFYDEALSGTVHIELMSPQRLPSPVSLGEGEFDFSASIAERQGVTVKEALSGDLSLLTLFVAGLSHYEAGDYESAILRFSKALEQPSTGQLPNYTVDLHYFRGTVLLLKQDFVNAITDYEHTIALRPDLIAYNNLGVAYLGKGDYDSAVTNFNRVLALNPNDAQAYNNLGVAYLSIGNYDSAITNVNQSLALNPNDANAYDKLGTAYSVKGDYDRAIANINRALALKPDYAVAYNNLGTAYSGKGDYDRAIANINRALALNPNEAVAYNNLGGAYGGKGDYDSAIANCNRAIALRPNFVEAYNNLGMAYSGKGDYDRAIANINRAIALNPNYAVAYLNRRSVILRKAK